jgi:membrane peptidoglycan carboxypeptidase
MPVTELAFRPDVNVSIATGNGRFSAVDQWPVLGVHRRGAPRAEMAQAFRQVLSLLVAVKKPTAYLQHDRGGLDARVDRYLRALASTGVMPQWLCEESNLIRVQPLTGARAAAAPAVATRKALDAVRAELSARLGVNSLYDLDRLDAAVRTTLDGAVNEQVSAALYRLGTRDDARQAGLLVHPLLGRDDPARVVYGVTVYEQTPNGNELRVQADNFHQPLNINQGTKLELGSTAKLRTLTTYLEAVTALHADYSAIPTGAVQRPDNADPLTRWAFKFLAQAHDRSLPAMLEAAMNRRYSAGPGESFFTGGGRHQFHNFDAKHNGRMMTVREAFQQSVNLVFIRLMRDLVRYHSAPEAARMLEDSAHPARGAYLARFADREGAEFLRRFYRKHRTTPVDAAVHNIVRGSVRAAVLYRSTWPDAGVDQFAKFLTSRDIGRNLPLTRIQDLYDAYDPARWTLNDRGYLAGIHPLELWLLAYLRHHPGATLAEVMSVSAGARQDAYAWLFKTSRKRAQDIRIRTELEIDAFEKIHAVWRRHGYPFSSLVPSYASAIGSSGDNPSALSELMGIILNDGVRRGSFRIDQLTLADRTPYETQLARRPSGGERVFSPDVAAVLQRELVGVVEKGTGRRLAGGVVLSDGRRFSIGGKTGTGDNRFETNAPHGARVVNRTAAFTFSIGDRFFGTVVAYVPGRAAASYAFTSALPIQVFKHLLPVLAPLWDHSQPRPA